MSRVRVTIDRVVLRGIDPADMRAFETAFRRELSRLLAASGNGIGAAGSRRMPVLRAWKMVLTPGPGGARELGSGIARAIGRGIGR